MSADPPGQTSEPSRRPKRGRLYALAIPVMLVGLGALAYQLLWTNAEGEGGAREFRRAVFPIKRKPAPAKLGVEYHFDRNAVVDSRLVGTQLVGLVASGNLVVVDAESFVPRGEKVLVRRASCLGPAEGSQVLVGIANGCIVRVALPDLTIEKVGEVPGVPRFIGKRGNGALVVAYQRDPAAAGAVLVRDQGEGRTYDAGVAPVFFLDSKDRLWTASGDKVFSWDLPTGARTELEWKRGKQSVRGFAELSDGQIWAFGGVRRAGEPTSFIARLAPGGKPAVLYQAPDPRSPSSAPTAPITHVAEDAQGTRVLVVSYDNVAVTDRSVTGWDSFDVTGRGQRSDDALVSLGQMHRVGGGLVLALARGGFMQVTAEFSRRHVVEGQNGVARPSEIVRLEKGMAMFGDGGPSFYVGGTWRALPDPVMPPAELMGPGRPGDAGRMWAAMLTIPLEGESSYVLAKAGPPRRYLGHIHGLRDTFLTARWDGKALTVLGREDLPIEPADTFATPDQRLWNVDDQGLWSYSSGRWQMVMRAASKDGNSGGHGAAASVAGGHLAFKSGIGEPLRFAASAAPPYYGMPSYASSWSLVRLDSNEEGGVPLIDEVPVSVDGRRALVHDLTAWGSKTEELLLATDHGLCVFNTKWSTCKLERPEGLGDAVSVFVRDGAKRLWLGGRGLWVLRDLKRAAPVHTAIPMLADTRVVAIAEAADGRMVVGLEDRGTVFVSLPQGWLDQPPGLPSSPVVWESTASHEPTYRDPGLVLRECREKGAAMSDAAFAALLAGLRDVAESIDPHVWVATESVYQGRPDIVVRGADPDKLLEKVLPALGKLGAKTPLAVWKREGARGSDTTQVKLCP